MTRGCHTHATSSIKIASGEAGILQRGMFRKKTLRQKEAIDICLRLRKVAKHLQLPYVNANRWPEGSLDSAKSLCARARPLSKSNEKNHKCVLVKVILKGFQNGTKKLKTHH